MNPTSEDLTLAKGLYLLLSKEEKTPYLEALQSLAPSLKRGEDLLTFLESYEIPVEKKLEVLKTLTDNYSLTYLFPFLSLAVKRHFINRYEEILEAYKKLYSDEFGLLLGIIYSARPLKDVQIKKFETLFSQKLKKKVSFQNIVDSSLLAGVKIFIDDQVYDDTLLEKLNELRKALLKENDYE